MDMDMVFELIFTAHKRNKTLGVTQFFSQLFSQAPNRPLVAKQKGHDKNFYKLENRIKLPMG
jgi:hypothetical protein